MSEHWIIYCDNARRMWDAMEDDQAGAVGSNWTPVRRETADAFIREMEAMEGWTRGHWNSPRF